MFDDDLSELFDEDEHAVSVSLNGKSFTGIVNEEFTEGEYGTVDDDRQSPVLYTSTNDAIGAEYDNDITVDGKALFVKGIHPDGTGITVLVLSASK